MTFINKGSQTHSRCNVYIYYGSVCLFLPFKRQQKKNENNLLLIVVVTLKPQGFFVDSEFASEIPKSLN